MGMGIVTREWEGMGMGKCGISRSALQHGHREATSATEEA